MIDLLTLVSKWIEGRVRCRICGHEHHAIAPYPDPGLHDLECSQCGNFSCDEIEDEPNL